MRWGTETGRSVPVQRQEISIENFLQVDENPREGARYHRYIINTEAVLFFDVNKNTNSKTWSPDELTVLLQLSDEAKI